MDNQQLQSVLQEAALVFAGDEEDSAKAAEDILMPWLNKKSTAGGEEKRLWYMLLDIYYAQEDKINFEKVSLIFSNRFGCSPPSWAQKKEELEPKRTVESGKNVLIIDGAATGELLIKAKEFIAAAREMRTCKIDLSRMKMDKSNLEGISTLQTIMAQLRKYKINATLMGENHVESALKRLVMESEKQEIPDIKKTPYWMLFLEILQWRGLMDEFEDFSYRYTVTFEVSGPGWEPHGVMSIEQVEEIQDDPREQDGWIEAPEKINDVEVNSLQEKIKDGLDKFDAITIDFSKVKKMNFSSTGPFCMFLSDLKEAASKITVLETSELIYVLLELVGANNLVQIQPKKR